MADQLTQLVLAWVIAVAPSGPDMRSSNWPVGSQLADMITGALAWTKSDRPSCAYQRPSCEKIFPTSQKFQAPRSKGSDGACPKYNSPLLPKINPPSGAKAT